MRAREWAAQAVLYALFMGVVAAFSSAPSYRPLSPDASVVTVSLLHHGERVSPCRAYTQAELARMPPNMRAPQKCERERVPVTVEVDIDGVNVLHETGQPSGLSRDGASSIYRRLHVLAGEHRITVRLKDAPGAAFNHTREATLRLKPAQVLVIDFEQGKGITLS